MVNLRFKSLVLSLIMLFAACNLQACELWRKYRALVGTVAVVGVIYWWWNSEPNDNDQVDIPSYFEKIIAESRRIKAEELKKQADSIMLVQREKVKEIKEKSLESYIASNQARLMRMKEERNRMKVDSPTITESPDEEESS